MKFIYPYILILLAFVPLFFFYIRKTQKNHHDASRQWGASPSPYNTARPYLLSAALACVITALARPAASPEIINTKEISQDAVFLVDVSRSMETRDQNGQSRLSAVKQALTDLVPFLGADRVALAAFAGTAVPKCPLTDDYAFFMQSVQLLDTNSASRGGTLLGDALRSVKKYYKVPGKHLTVWVFTDGGDQESFPVEAARSLSDDDDGGISLYIWGTGTVQGGEVPERNITSVLNEDLLRQTAQAVKNGRYFGAEYPLWKFQSVYQSLRKPSFMNETKTVVRDDKGWFLIWPALILLCIDALYVPRTKKSTRIKQRTKNRTRTKNSGRSSGKKQIFGSIIFFLAVPLLSITLSGCTKQKDDIWTTPADEKQITSLAQKTFENPRNKEMRARLFFLWGQELFEKDPVKAAAAFASVIDTGSILSEEARINYELLMKQQQAQQEQQSQQDQENQQDQKEQSEKDKKDDSENKNGNQSESGADESGGQDEQSESGDKSDRQNEGENQQAQPNQADSSEKTDSGEDQADPAGKADSGGQESDGGQPRDMSSFVRSKEEQAPFDEALKAEMQRQSQKQQSQANQPVPLDKDW